MRNLEELKKHSDTFFNLCRRMVEPYPWAVVISMHHFARSLYPEDPYIPFQEEICPTERIYEKISGLIGWMNETEKLGTYPVTYEKLQKDGDIKDHTGRVYGQFWKDMSFHELTDHAVMLIKTRLKKNGFDTGRLRDRSTIDIGCGSGRFSFALRKLGCNPVTGVDYGKEGISIANDIVHESGIEGLTFQKANVLELPFRDESFDFVFCNGVLHHTENLKQGLSEMIRVAAKGALGFLYLYADGGLFWYARKHMPEIMKQIPQNYTHSILNSIGMPPVRFIFADNWYVPIENHTSDVQARSMLNELGISKITRLEHGRPTDLEEMAIHGGQVGKILYGDGELRYIFEK